jgi:hypothetical protein
MQIGSKVNELIHIMQINFSHFGTFGQIIGSYV